MGGALSLLAERIDAEVHKSTPEKKGDWRPLVFIMTDGAPTDNWERGLEDFRKTKCAMVVAFKWVSASISFGSQKVESSHQEISGLNELPPPPPEVNIVL